MGASRPTWLQRRSRMIGEQREQQQKRESYRRSRRRTGLFGATGRGRKQQQRGEERRAAGAQQARPHAAAGATYTMKDSSSMKRAWCRRRPPTRSRRAGRFCWRLGGFAKEHNRPVRLLGRARPPPSSARRITCACGAASSASVLRFLPSPSTVPCSSEGLALKSPEEETAERLITGFTARSVERACFLIATVDEEPN